MGVCRCIELSTDADRAIDRNRRIIGQGKRPKRRLCGRSFYRARLRCIQRVGAVKRDQKGDAGRNGVIAGQRSVSRHNDGFLACFHRCVNRRIQVGVRLVVHAEGRRGIGADIRLRLNARGCGRLHRGGVVFCLLDIVQCIRARDQPCREQNHDHQQRQCQRQNALESLLHFFWNLLFYVTDYIRSLIYKGCGEAPLLGLGHAVTILPSSAKV